MSRLISLLVGIYVGIVTDQNFEIPRLPIPSALVDEVKKLTDGLGSKDKRK